MNLKDIIPQLPGYVERKLLSEQVHPEDSDVRIYNYTQEVQFSGAWDDVTRNCRGLILNIATGEIIARPFPKFFNYSEYISKGWPIPQGQMEVAEKLDGSLGILYALNGKSWIATRGSFTSDQAIWATDWFHKMMETNSDGCVNTDRTALFEIIYPENRIVVPYDFSGLVHLATIDIATGKTLQDPWPKCRKAALHDISDLTQLAALDEKEGEGFVVYFPGDDVRLKFKFPEYIRLHKIVTGLSEIGIWEHLRDGGSVDDLIKDVPDEFFQWVMGIANRMEREYDEILSRETALYIQAMQSVDTGGPDNHATRKDKAVAIQKYMTVPAIGYALLDEHTKDRNLNKIIWKMIRPKGQKTFTVDTDA